MKARSASLIERDEPEVNQGGYAMNNAPKKFLYLIKYVVHIMNDANAASNAELLNKDI